MICVSLGWRSQRQEGPGARERVSRELCFRAGRPDAAARAGGHLDLAPPLSPFFRAVLIWHFEKKCSQTVTCRSSSYVFKEPTVRRTDRQTGNRKERDTSAERKRHKPNAPQKRQRLKKAATKGPPTSEAQTEHWLQSQPSSAQQSSSGYAQCRRVITRSTRPLLGLRGAVSSVNVVLSRTTLTARGATVGG